MTGIRAIALDVDGVLTDGGVWWGPNGEEWKRFSFADIMGVSRARKAGYVLALISGEDSPLVDRFAQKLGITYIEKNCTDKETALRRFSESTAVPLNQICFMGDDVNDAAAMSIAGLAAVPANAQLAVREKAAFVATRNGGNGAVRELVEALLASKTSGL
jgi:3-deoxy-D-manno-octulosonate 8-phosphate phosphatase (KDO 8-P phosphatase)